MQPEITNLPQSAQLIVQLIGLPATVLLVERHGGKDLVLHQRGDSIKNLGAVIGLDAAEKLFAYYGRDVFTVPLCTAALKELRNRKIIAEFDRLTGREIDMTSRAAIHVLVDEFGLTERQIRRIFKSASVPRQAKQKPIDERQLSLI